MWEKPHGRKGPLWSVQQLCPPWRMCRWVPFSLCPMTSPLTFFRTTNSFSAVALRATSSSYLSVGKRGAEAWIPSQIPGKNLFWGSKGINSLQMLSCPLHGLFCQLFMGQPSC